jgi:adenosine deaminase
MPEPLTREVLKDFPKVELHRHLEGTFAVSRLHRMARDNGLDVPEDEAAFAELVRFPEDAEPDFLRFLSLFRNTWYRSLRDVEEITAASVREFALDGIFYIELRFSPEHFPVHNGFDRRDVTRAVTRAGNAAAAEHNIEIRYLITLNRSKQAEEEMVALYELVRDLAIPEIVGIDLAGDETSFPPHLFERLFDRVTQDGLFGKTIHAGEVSPPDQIWESISRLGADRIGHGVSAVHDSELQRHLASNGITLEQCVTSNYLTGAWTDEPSHPLGTLHRNGVPVTINSDDPTIQNSDLTLDYEKAARYFGFTMDDFVDVNVRALDAAFLTDEERSRITRAYLTAVDEYRTAAGM